MKRFTLALFLTGLVFADNTAINERSELVSYAQDIFRQKGINISRSAMNLEVDETWGRIFYIRLLSRHTTLSSDLLEAFLVGGAVSQHARSPMDQIVVIAEIEFSQRGDMILRAVGDCCEKLYNNRMSPDVFTEDCIWMEQTK